MSRYVVRNLVQMLVAVPLSIIAFLVVLACLILRGPEDEDADGPPDAHD